MARKPAAKAPAAETETPVAAAQAVTSKQAVLVPLDTLIPYDKNPRDNSKAIDSVAASIKEYGFLVPIVVDSENVIVAGHTRYQASVKLGLVEVPVLVADHLSERQIQAFRLVDNKTAELAVWDFDLLAAEVSELMESGIDLVPFGWSQSEVDCLHDMVGADCLNEVLEEDAAAQGGTEGITNRFAQGGGDGITGAKQANKGSNVISKDPKSVRIAIGEINFFVDIELYRNWAHEVRKENGFDMARVISDLSGRLRIEARPLARSPKQESEDREAMAQALKDEAAARGVSRAEVAEEAAKAKRKAPAGTVVPRTRTPAPKSDVAVLRDAVDAAEA